MIRPQLKEFMRRMAPKSVAIIPGAHDTRRSNDTHYRFRQDSDFFYLTGFEEPDASRSSSWTRHEVHALCAATRSGKRDLGRAARRC